MNDTWDKVMSFKTKDDKHKGVANTLTDDEINTIAATIDFLGGDYRQDVFDLTIPRYRVFDWLAMRVGGRHTGSPQDFLATQVLVHSFIKSGGVPSKFIWDLRETDYQIDDSYKVIKLEGYND